MSPPSTKTQTPKMMKIAMSLPPALVGDLDYLSARLGVSRSSLAAELLRDAAKEMRDIISLIPPNPTPADLLRARGTSKAYIRQRVEKAAQLADDLFAGVDDFGDTK
jgi:hypothetical protein